MKKKLLSLIICGVLSCSAFAGASSHRPADITQAEYKVCLISVGNDGVFNGNAFTGLRTYDKGDSVHTNIYFGNTSAFVVNPTMADAKRWTESFITLLRTRCGAI